MLLLELRKGVRIHSIAKLIVPVCLIVLSEKNSANQLVGQLIAAETPISNLQLVEPALNQQEPKIVKENNADSIEDKESPSIQPIKMDSVKLLNPKLAKKARQKWMSLWLMPFGLVAGLTFSQMTDLRTFSNLGFGKWGELFFGSLLGMGSGLLGSYFAAGSINTDKNDDLKVLRKHNQEGKWLLLIETPLEIELPWHLFEQAKPIEVIGLSDQ